MILVFIFLLGCGLTQPTQAANPTPSSLESIPLTIAGQAVQVSIQQDGKTIPVLAGPAGGFAALHPAPFTLAIQGNKKIVSVMALESANQAKPLIQIRGLVTIVGTGNAFSDRDLFVFKQPLELYDINRYTLHNLTYFLYPPEKALETSELLQKEAGTEPQALFSARSYLKDDEQSFQVEKLGGQAIQPGQTITLVVFLEAPSQDPAFSLLQPAIIELVFQ